MSQKIHIFSCTSMIVTPYIYIYIDLLSINLNFLSVLLHYYDQWLWNLYCTNNNMIAKYTVFSNIICVAWDSTLRVCIQEPLLILKKIIVLLHILSAYNSFLVRYKVYPSDHRECLCTQAQGMVKPMKSLVLI